jgi:aminopeptidase N
MKKLLTYLGIFIFALISINLKTQESKTKPWDYNINIEFKDSILFINLSLKTFKTSNWNKNFFLFNRYIKIDEVLLNGKPLTYTRSNDTLYFESSSNDELNLTMRYKIPCSLSKSSKLIKTYGDCIFAYPAQIDTNQIFCERYSKYYPVIYDNISNYKVKIAIPNTYSVYCESHVIDYKSEGKEKIYSYNYFDEDLRFFITKSDIFQTKKVIQRDSTYYEFNFLPKDKRLLAVKNKKPQYITDLSQMDSLYNVIVNRSVQAVQWYNENLWRQRIDTLPFIETGILGLAVNVRSFIIFDRSLMNMEVLDNYAFSHEIGHFWIGYNIQYSSKGFYFLSESLNEYTNLLFYENWAGKAEFENAINNKINMQYSDKEFFTTTFEQVLNQRNGDLKFELIYNKGVVFAHELRKMIGKENFLQIIRDTYHKPDNYITLTDFENSIKKNGCWNEYMKLYKMRL